MWINTQTGGRIDISPAFAGNLNGGSLLGEDAVGAATLGNEASGITQNAPTLGMFPEVVRNPQPGDWIRVPDETVTGRSNLLVNSLDHYEFFAGGQTYNLPTNTVRGDSDWSNIVRNDNYTYSNVYVMYTGASRAGLMALGLIPTGSPNSATPGDANPGIVGGGSDTTGKLNFLGFTGLLGLFVVAGLAVYFLPRSAFKGVKFS